MKYDNTHYYEAPRIFWTVKYEEKRDSKKDKTIFTACKDDKYEKYRKLSVYAKWLYQTLKELEHRYTGKKNNKRTVIYEGFDNSKNWFYCGMDKLEFLSGISESKIREARVELKNAGLIDMCTAWVVDSDNKKTRSTGYSVYGEMEIRLRERGIS